MLFIHNLMQHPEFFNRKEIYKRWKKTLKKTTKKWLMSAMNG